MDAHQWGMRRRAITDENLFAAAAKISPSLDVRELKEIRHFNREHGSRDAIPVVEIIQILPAQDLEKTSGNLSGARTE